MRKPEDLLRVEDAAVLTGASLYDMRNAVLSKKLPAYLSRERKLVVSLTEARAWLDAMLNPNHAANRLAFV